MINVDYNGKHYTTRKDLALALEVNIKTLNKYIDKFNGDIYKAIESIENIYVLVYYNEKLDHIEEFHSIMDLSNKYDINRKKLTDLIKEQFKVDDLKKLKGKIVVTAIVDKLLKEQEKYVYITPDGKKITARTYEEMAEYLKMKTKIFIQYMKKANDDVNKAMELYEDKHTLGFIDGNRIHTQEEAAEYLGVSIPTFLSYYKKNDKNLQETANKIREMLKNQNRSLQYEFNGEFCSKSKIYELTGIPPKQLDDILIELGISKQSLEAGDKVSESYISEAKKKYKKSKIIVYNDKEYKTLKECLKANHIATSTFYTEKGKYPPGTDISIILASLSSNPKSGKVIIKSQNTTKTKRVKNKINKTPVYYSYDNIIYKTKKALANYIKINYNTLRKYIERFCLPRQSK